MKIVVVNKTHWPGTIIFVGEPIEALALFLRRLEKGESVAMFAAAAAKATPEVMADMLENKKIGNVEIVLVFLQAL